MSDFGDHLLPVAPNPRGFFLMGLLVGIFNLAWCITALAIGAGVVSYAIHRGWNW